MDEFELITRCFAPLGTDARDVVLGIGDDAAVLAVPPGHTLAVAVDTLVNGVHFPADIAPADLGYRVAAVNLSDLAAMGAEPRWATLALTLPAAEPAWVETFAGGLADACAPHGVALVGGDTTRGPLCVTVQLMGLLERAPLTRAGAQAGDVVLVSGSLGDARAALDCLDAAVTGRANDDVTALRARYFRPAARVALGRALAPLAHAAIDVSDGLLADLGHLAQASNVAITVRLDQLPLSAALVRHCAREQALEYAASGGDDYELALCVPRSACAAARAAAARLGVPLTAIGEVTAGRGVRCLDADGAERRFAAGGYRHF
ncbi:MAG: thiamine-phosphate kinase [Gammaproteobacteria bacterium]